MLDYVSGTFVPTQVLAVDISSVDQVLDHQQIYVGGTGDVKVDVSEPRSGIPGGAAVITTVTFKAVPVGFTIQGNFTKVYKTGTTATFMIAQR